jgi:hypothetical protein
MREAIPQPGDLVRRHRRVATLTIINPESLSSNTWRNQGPGTPWEGEVLALEQKKMRFDVPVCTPSERRDFLLKVRQLVKDGALSDLNVVLKAAEASEAGSPSEERAAISMEVVRESKPGTYSGIPSPIKMLDGSLTHVADSIKVENHNMAEAMDGNSHESARNTNGPVNSNGQSGDSFSRMRQSAAQKHIASTLNKLGQEGATVLMLACDLDKSVHDENSVILPICKLLTEYGAVVAGVDKQGRTCLHRCVYLAVGVYVTCDVKQHNCGFDQSDCTERLHALFRQWCSSFSIRAVR